MFGVEAPQHPFGSCGQVDLEGRIAAQGAQRVEDHGDVDALLQQRTGGRWQPSDRGNGHRGQRQAHADDGALHGDAPRPAGDVHRVGEPVQPISGQYDIGGFRGRGGAACTHRHADAGRGQCGGVVDAVADHHGYRAVSFGAHGGDLVGRALFGVYLVQPQHGGDLAGGPGAVSGEHHQSI